MAKAGLLQSISTVKSFRHCHRLLLIACLLWSCTGQCSVMPASVFWKKKSDFTLQEYMCCVCDEFVPFITVAFSQVPLW